MLATPHLFRFPIPVVAVDHFLIGSGASDDLRECVVQTIRSVTPEVLAARVGFVARCDARRELAEVQVPTLYLQAADDRLVGTRSLNEILTGKPDTEIVRLSGPHFLLQREPLEATEAIADFVRLRCV
jgi:pimeloyl-ACP methyl ester carboxylesterase